jgi:hypothetical protein
VTDQRTDLRYELAFANRILADENVSLLVSCAVSSD